MTFYISLGIFIRGQSWYFITCLPCSPLYSYRGKTLKVSMTQVSIVPPDARESEQYVEKEGEPPGPAQAAFKGLVPGRAYNISVQTVSEPEISAPTTAQYRTVPLRPRNVTLDLAARTETSFRVTWLPPLEERYVLRYSSLV